MHVAPLKNLRFRGNTQFNPETVAKQRTLFSDWTCPSSQPIISLCLQTCCFSPTSLRPPLWTGSPRPSSRGFRCSGAPPSPSAAPPSHSTQEAPSSSPSPPPPQHSTTPSQLSITPPISCFLLQSPPTKEATAVFITSTFFLMTSSLRAVWSLSLSQVSWLFICRFGKCDWSEQSENDQLTTEKL